MISSNIKETIRSKKRAGVSFPLSSILSEKSFGVGDIYSLDRIGEWAFESGVSILQILPLNDLGFGRSPYSSISAFAIDPIYISLYLLGINEINSDLKKFSDDRVILKQKKISILRGYFKKIYNDSEKKSLNIFINTYNCLI
jgi:4-alpha-glucanotransferase